MINGTFNVHEPYIARIFVFENDLQFESVSTESFKSSPQPKLVTGNDFAFVFTSQCGQLFHFKYTLLYHFCLLLHSFLTTVLSPIPLPRLTGQLI